MHGRNGIKFHEYRVSIISSTRDLFDRSTYRRRGSTCFPFSPLFFLFVTWDNIFSSFFSRLKSIARGQMFWFLDSVERRKGFGRGLILVPTRIMRHRFERFLFFFPPSPFPPLPLSSPNWFIAKECL